MARISLDVVSPVASKPVRLRKAAPKMPNERCLELARNCSRAGTDAVAQGKDPLAAAAAILRQEAANLPAKKEGQRDTWREHMEKTAAALEARTLRHEVFEAGNTKLSFFAFSALSIITCPGRGDCENWCYTLTGWRSPCSFLRQLQNTLLLMFAPELVAAAFLALPEGVVLRLYVDGDFDSAERVAFWFRLLERRPDVRAYGYSKSWEEIWAYAQANPLPTNYLLNLSGGGRPQRVGAEQMESLSITRGRFDALAYEWRPAGKSGNIGFGRYSERGYYEALRKAALGAGYRRFFLCPGVCDDCCNGDHACGNDRFRGVVIINGAH